MKETPKISNAPESDIPDFSRTQLHIMQILWDAGDSLKPAEIQAQFKWSIENATLRSVLAVMLERKDLTREKRGKAFHYFPSKRKITAISDIFSGLARLFGNGSSVGLMSQLIQEDSLSAEEIQQLRDLANSLNDFDHKPKP